MSLLGCCSINLAVSNIVLVNAPPDVLWEVLKDFEALSQILDYTVQSVKVSLPPSTQIIVSQSQSEDKNKSIQVGTQIHEVRVLKKNKKPVCLRRVVTKIVEDATTNEYSISFNSYYDEIPNQSSQLDVCNTSTLSIVPLQQNSDTKRPSSVCCQLVGSFAVDVGHSSDKGIMSYLCYCPMIYVCCFKPCVKRHAEYQFHRELQHYGAEAERRYTNTH